MATMSKKQLSNLGLAALAVISIAERRYAVARNSAGAFAKLLPVLREWEPSQFR